MIFHVFIFIINAWFKTRSIQSGKQVLVEGDILPPRIDCVHSRCPGSCSKQHNKFDCAIAFWVIMNTCASFFLDKITGKCVECFKTRQDKMTSTEISQTSEQGWGSGESARLPPMWPGFDSRIRGHMWVEFVVGSLPCSEGFSPGSPVSSLLKNQHSKF